MTRNCIRCSAPIEESMGVCLARDVLAVMRGEARSIREICGGCATRMDLDADLRAAFFWGLA